MITPDQLAKPGTEHSHQSAFFCWAAQELFNCNDRSELALMFAIPNGGERNPAVASKLKAEGVKSGVPDIFLPVKGRYLQVTGQTEQVFHGLFIEMKKPEYRTRKNGGLSDPQLMFFPLLFDQGFQVVVCYTWQEAVKAVCSYMGWKDEGQRLSELPSPSNVTKIY